MQKEVLEFDSPFKTDLFQNSRNHKEESDIDHLKNKLKEIRDSRIQA
jgi:hypothetical protein